MIQMKSQGITGSPVRDMYGLFDPSLVGGAKLIYEKLIPFRIRYVDFNQQVKQFNNEQDLIVRIVVKGIQSDIGQLRIQLQNSNDLFFNWEIVCNTKTFQEMKQRQGFTGTLEAFATVLIQSFNNLQAEKDKFGGLITIISYSKLSMSVVQYSPNKNLEVFNLDFVASTQERVQPVISYRYDKMSKDVELTENRLQIIYEVIKEKFPSLLVELEKVRSPKK